MKIEELKKHKKILIVGYGIEGKSVHRFLSKFVPDSTVTIADKKNGDNYLERQHEFDLVIKSPSVPLKNIVQKHTTLTNIFFANTPNKIIGVTGTKGKSSSVQAIHSILTKAGYKSWLVGNIGIPALDIFFEDVQPNDYIVYELSSYQLEDIEYSPDIACFINFYEELHNHDSVQHYFEAKKQLITHLTADDLFIYNPSHKVIEDLTKLTDAQIMPFIEIPEKYKNIASEINFSDDVVRASWTVARAVGISDEEIALGLRTALALPHRLQNIGTYHGITFINDSAANHSQATVHALTKLQNVETLLIGGQNRDFDFEPVVEQLPKTSVKNIVLFPDTHDIIRSHLNNSGEDYTIIYTDSMEQAVDFAFKHTQPGNICLLSPGAPSYLMFDNFVQRGNVFTQLVRSYEKQNPKNETNLITGD